MNYVRLGRLLTRRLQLALLTASLATPLAGQGGLSRVGGWSADSARVAGLSGGSLPSLLRTSTAGMPGDDDGLSWGLVAPEVGVLWSSDLPPALARSAAWAGRGVTAQLSAGFAARLGPLSMVIAPELAWTENLDFRHLEVRSTERSRFVAPWRVGATSADLPIRFGDRSFAVLSPGQSTVELRAGPVGVGVSSAAQWWGPGIRNALVLSDHAGGIPHAFARTARPIRTPVGEIEGRWMIGGLSESLYFDNDPANDLRSFSAVAAALRPRFEPNLSVGFARAVYAPVESSGDLAGHAADVLTRWSARSLEGGADDSPAEQITSVFARWVFPASGLETYGEWARLRLPTSLDDFLEAPEHTLGYTLGLQWAHGLAGGGRTVRVQAELTSVEQSSTYRRRETPFYYQSEAIPQGYTHRGRTIGAAIGPGASSQWLGADLMGDGWRAGVFASRIRWDNDAYYTQPVGQHYLAHDVSVLGGVRGGRREEWGDWSAELVWENRLNYLFQNTSLDFHANRAVDIHNAVLQLVVRPSLGRARRGPSR